MKKKQSKKQEKKRRRRKRYLCHLRLWSRRVVRPELSTTRSGRINPGFAPELTVLEKTKVKPEKENTERTKEGKETQKEIHTELGDGMVGVGPASTAILESLGLKGEGKTKKDSDPEDLPGAAEVDPTTSIPETARHLKQSN